MPYQIRCEIPRYDNRDGLCGSRTYLLPNTYETLGLAQAIASKHAYEECACEIVEAVSGRLLRDLQAWAPVSVAIEGDYLF